MILFMRTSSLGWLCDAAETSSEEWGAAKNSMRDDEGMLGVNP